MQKISTCLWFDTEAEQAMDFYTSIFKNSKKGRVDHYGEAGPGKAGTVITCMFEIEGRQFMGLNGGPYHKFNEAISLVVNCVDQAEVDYYWEKLLADGGREDMCSWLKDKYGLSWQVVPEALPRLLGDPDRAKSNRVMEAMLKMQKIIVADLEKAYAG